MLIHHVNDDGKKVIISIFIVGEDCENENKFFNDLNFELWNLDGDNVCLADSAPNLDEMLFFDLNEEDKKKEDELK